MKTLFIDTHSEKITMILKDEQEIFCEENVSDRSHSEIAIPTLETLLSKAGAKLGDIDELIVVNGPGSFTGVRIGVTIAKTIAYSLNIPIKTITSLEMYGESTDKTFDLVALKDSKGVYSAKIEDGKYTDFNYQRQNDFEKYVDENKFQVLEDKVIDINKICHYLEAREYENPHKVNPIYIKEIDALK